MFSTLISSYKIILFIFVGVFLLSFLYNIIKYYVFIKKRTVKKIYIKSFPFYLDILAKKRVRIAGEFLGIILLTSLVTFTVLSNSTPLGITVQYSLEKNNGDISSLGPNDRVKSIMLDGEKLSKLSDDL